MTVCIVWICLRFILKYRDGYDLGTETRAGEGFYPMSLFGSCCLYLASGFAHRPNIACRVVIRMCSRARLLLPVSADFLYRLCRRGLSLWTLTAAVLFLVRSAGCLRSRWETEGFIQKVRFTIVWTCCSLVLCLPCNMHLLRVCTRLHFAIRLHRTHSTTWHIAS